MVLVKTFLLKLTYSLLKSRSGFFMSFIFGGNQRFVRRVSKRVDSLRRSVTKSTERCANGSKRLDLMSGRSTGIRIFRVQHKTNAEKFVETR